MSTRKLRTLGLITLLLVSFTVTGALCRKKQGAQSQTQTSQIKELHYYRLFDDSDIFQPLITQYLRDNPGIRIVYKKFTDPEKYEEMIVNELAEGEGPDIFSVPNTWITKHYKKLVPAPPAVQLTPDIFRQAFVDVAARDLVRKPPGENEEHVYGIPLALDTLALYYNKNHFEDAIPERGRPAQTWEGLKNDVIKLTKKDNSFARFQRSGIAMGRADNILRAVDIITLLFLQHKVPLYNDDYSKIQLQESSGLDPFGRSAFPTRDALGVFTSFAFSDSPHATWNEFLADGNSLEKELIPFIQGKVSMIFGFSYLYEQLQNAIRQATRAPGAQVISPDSIRIAPVPQVAEKADASGKRVAYANYFVETVSRTSKYPEEAWRFLIFIGQKENAAYFQGKTHRPPARRDLITQASQDPVFGVFASQVGYAESLPIYDEKVYKEALEKAVKNVLATGRIDEAIREIAQTLAGAMPEEGILPPAQPRPIETQ